MLFILYLSLYSIGTTFLGFQVLPLCHVRSLPCHVPVQWDILLLETGFLAIFAAPLLPSRDPLDDPGHILT